MSLCTSGVVLQVLPFTENRHFGEHFSLPAVLLCFIVSMYAVSDFICDMYLNELMFCEFTKCLSGAGFFFGMNVYATFITYVVSYI